MGQRSCQLFGLGQQGWKPGRQIFGIMPVAGQYGTGGPSH